MTLGRKAVRITSKILLFVIGLFLVLFATVWLIIKVPAVQNYIVKKSTGYVSEKTHTRVVLKYIDLEFPKSILLQGIFLEDTNKDTLASIQEIKVDLNMLALLSNSISIETFELNNFNIRLIRNDKDSTFNYQFLLNAFTSPKTKNVIIDTTATSPWTIKAHAISFVNGHFNMQDAVSGMNIDARIGNIEAALNLLDLQNNIAELGAIHLSNVHGNILRTKQAIPDTTTSEGWKGINVSEITIDHSSFLYKDVLSSLLLDLNIGDFELNETIIDLSVQKVISKGIALSNSTFNIKIPLTDTTTIVKKDSTVSDWNIKLASLDLKENNFKMDMLQTRSITKGIDWNHLQLSHLNTSTKNIIYNGPHIEAAIESLMAQDKSGFGIRSLQTSAYMDAHKARLTDLSLTTNHSHIGQNIEITFASLNDITSSLGVDCNMKKNSVAIKDLLLLVPSLDTVDIIQKNKDRVASFDLIAKGNLNQLDIQQFTFNTSTTRIDTKGKIRSLTNADKLFIDLTFNPIKTTAEDLIAILPDSTIPSSIQLPEEIYLKGNYKGTLSDFVAAFDMSSSIGNAFLHADIKDLQKENPSYTLALQTHNFNAGKLLQQTSIGIINGSIDIKGIGINQETAIATVQSKIESIELSAYNYHNIELDGNINKNVLDITGNIEDENLSASILAKADLNKETEFYNAEINLKGIDLYATGFTTEKITFSANSEIHLLGDPTKNINGNISTRNILVIQNGKRYKEDSLILVSINEPGNASVKLNSSMLAASFEGNIDVFSVSDALIYQLNSYFHFSKSEMKKPSAQNFAFDIVLNDSPLLREVILPSLSDYSAMHINGLLNTSESKLTINANIPRATYGNLSVKDFNFNIDSDIGGLNYKSGWSKFSSGGFTLQETILSGRIQHDSIGISLNVKDTDGNEKINLNAFLTHVPTDHYRFSILKNGLSLQSKQWIVADKNYIEFAKNYIFAEQFNLTNNSQAISLQSTNDGNDMNLNFHNFNFHTLSQIIEDDSTLIQGVLNGDVELKNIQNNPAFTSDLEIRNLTYKQSRVGNLKIKADNLTTDRYTANIVLTDSTNKATISGYYLSSNEESALNFNADIESIDLHSLEAFSGDQISQSSGTVKGDIKITGPISKPVFNGDIHFINASTKVIYINQRLYMKNETINLNQEKVSFNSFTILDTLNNKATINGYVGIKSFNDITFNLDVKTDHFMVLNTTAVNNKLYYGKVILDSRISIKGDQDLPIINADVNIVGGSHFTFAIPDSKVSVDRGDGIVVFTNDSSSLDPIMLREDSISLATTEKFTGLDVSAQISIDKKSTLKLLVDPVSGDSLSVRGDADLNFKMDSYGQTNLTGRYVVSDGTYKASLENLVVRNFKISRGSTIIWSGDPLNALIDIKATYTTKTTPDGLLANTAVTDSSALRKPLPFIVEMSMEGELLKPLISFQLDMPDSEKGALGGEVYSKITSINANESEVNKQVFALLVLNKFITPDNTSSGGASDFARRSVSRMMSNELNKLSSKYVEGLQINVDVQSYNGINNGQAQGNTQVAVGVTKSLFNERLSVQIGGNVPVEGQDASSNSNAKNITGDVTVEYKLTKNGRYKAKAFRTNQYDGISNGTIVATGAGLMYIRNFTHLKELFISKKKRKKLQSTENTNPE
jgi:hypothetical protein